MGAVGVAPFPWTVSRWGSKRCVGCDGLQDGGQFSEGIIPPHKERGTWAWMGSILSKNQVSTKAGQLHSAAYSLPIGSAWYVRCFTAWPDTGSTRTLGS
jgi:hypothetical protein